ncbi:MAG: hypothetical protein H6Q86_1647 [candidate division NC10 bacterium]|jgi:hypothetical protein|nr:hypothetical protein [candidate division NC10 bacterium]
MNRRTTIHADRERTFLFLPNSAAVRHILNQLDAAHDALDEECEICVERDRDSGD